MSEIFLVSLAAKYFDKLLGKTLKVTMLKGIMINWDGLDVLNSETTFISRCL